MKSQIFVFTTQLTSSPWRTRAIVLGITVLALIVGVAGIAEAGPAGGISPMP